jgi:hypothetical protein
MRVVGSQDCRDMEAAAHMRDTQLLFRRINEQVQKLDDHRGRGNGDAIRVICECGTESCIEQIDMTLAEYQRIRADRELFVILPEHDALGVHEVGLGCDRYSVVRARGAATLRRVS